MTHLPKDSRDEDRESRQRPKSYIPPLNPSYTGSSVNGVSDPPAPSERETLQRNVSSAVNNAPALQSVHDPNLIAAVTAEVVKNLYQTGVLGTPLNTNNPASPNPLGATRPTTPPYHSEPQIPLFDMENQSDAGRRPSSPPRRTAESQPPRDQSRPTYTTRLPTDDATPLERMWQTLFDSDGKGTHRLGQLLRGLAIHIIDDFEPKKSLVIPPQKMLMFFENVKLAEECYPWSEIFGGKIDSTTLSLLYRELNCEHHYIQATSSSDQPQIPALTPVGFQNLMQLLIRAHPDEEYRRFSKAVLNMPISNADDVKERFPKELSRRLFPTISHMPSRILVDDAIYSLRGITKLRDYATEILRDGPPHQDTLQAAQTETSSKQSSSKSSATTEQTFEYGVVPSDAPAKATSSDATIRSNSPPAPPPIERQRQPYTAQPGGGRVYENGDKAEKPPTRSNTTSGATRPTIEDTADDYVIPARYRSGSVANGPAASRRYRSPSASHQSSQYSRSESTVPIVGSYQSTYTDEEDGLRRYMSNDERRRRAERDGPAKYEPSRYEPAKYEAEDYIRRSRHSNPPAPPPSYR